MLYHAGAVYLSDFYSVSCVNATDGIKTWSTYMSREGLAPGISYSYGVIYVVNEVGTLYVLDATTGTKHSWYQLGGDELHSIPTPYNGSLYLTSMDWNLYCFSEAPPAAPYTPTPTPAPLTADDIAQKVLEQLPAYPASPSADEVAQKVLASLPNGVSADAVAQRVLANLPANPTAQQIAQEITNQLPTTATASVPAEYSAATVVIVVAVVIALAVGFANLCLIRKRK